MMIRNVVLASLCALTLTGCVGMITGRMADNLSNAILNQNDPETVRTGAPAFLLLLDSLVLDAPDDPALLQASATLNGAYASVFVEDEERAARLTEKARDHGRRALCDKYPRVCAHESGPFDEFEPTLADIKPKHIDLLYTYGAAWAGWIETHSDDWNAVADLAKVEAVMARVTAIQPDYEWGRAYLYLGVLNSQLPATMGGNPEKGREFFERAIALSEGRDLIAKVELARRYARLMFDQGLHDSLLNEVIEADPTVPGLVLSNTLAQQEAEVLLAESAEYFEE